jgi:hypothetical protein
MRPKRSDSLTARSSRCFTPNSVSFRTVCKDFAGLRPDGDDDGVLILDRRERTGHVNRVKKSWRGSEAALS